MPSWRSVWQNPQSLFTTSDMRLSDGLHAEGSEHATKPLAVVVHTVTTDVNDQMELVVFWWCCCVDRATSELSTQLRGDFVTGFTAAAIKAQLPMMADLLPHP